jgi:hypothetical protein
MIYGFANNRFRVKKKLIILIWISDFI